MDTINKISINYDIKDAHFKNNRHGNVMVVLNRRFLNFQNGYIYKFKNINDYIDLTNDNEEIKELINTAFINGVAEIDLLFTDDENLNSDLDLLFENKEAKYIVFDNFNLDIYKEINQKIVENKLIAGFVSINEKNIDLKDIFIDCENLFLYNAENIKYIYSLVALASSVVSSKDIKSFRFKKIYGDFDFLENDIIEENYGVQIKRDSKGYFIDQIINVNDVNLESIIKSEYIINYINTQLNKNFKNRVNTKSKLEAIRFQSYLILINFQDTGLIDEFSIPKVFLYEDDCIVKIKFSVSDYFKKLKINTNIKF